MAPKRSREATRGGKQRGPKTKKVSDVPLPSAADDEDYLSDQDMDFVVHEASRLNFLAATPTEHLMRATPSKPSKKSQPPAPEPASSDSDSGVEESDAEAVPAYERVPRAAPVAPALRPKALPTRDLEGKLVYDAAPQLRATVDDRERLAALGVSLEDDLERREGEEALSAKARRAQKEREARAKKAQRELERRAAERAVEGRAAEAETRVAAAPESSEVARVLQELGAEASRAERRLALRQELARACQALLAAPEKSLASLRLVLELCSLEDESTALLARVSAAAVFVDVLPGYRIRTGDDGLEEGVQLSKDVLLRRGYEGSLLRAYQHYLKVLVGPLRSAPSQTKERALAGPAGARIERARAQAARVSVTCLSRLLLAAPHFNYVSDVLQALVPAVLSRDAAAAAAARGALEQLLGSRDVGAVRAAVEAVQLVADLVRRRRCECEPGAVRVLLACQISDIRDAADAAEARQARRRSKAGRKGGKPAKEVERDFAQSRADEVLARRKAQTAIVDALFEVFFRILKHVSSGQRGLDEEEETEREADEARAKEGASAVAPASASHVAFARALPRRARLLDVALQGLAKYVHLINIDFFPDVLAELELLGGDKRLPPLVRIRCLSAAAALLRGQGEALTMDRARMLRQIYACIDAGAVVPLVAGVEDDGEEAAPGNASKQGAADPRAPAQEPSDPALLPSLLSAVALQQRLLDLPRQAAFAKRSVAAALHTADSGAAMGLLAVVQRQLRQHPRLRGMLENEGGGPAAQRAFDPDQADPAAAGALAAPLWELSLGARHFHPHVAQVCARIAEGGDASSAEGLAALLPPVLSPEEVARTYSTGEGSFRPAPAKAGRARGASRLGEADAEVEVALGRVAHAVERNTEDFGWSSQLCAAAGPLTQNLARKKGKGNEAVLQTDGAARVGGEEADLLPDTYAAAYEPDLRSLFVDQKLFGEHRELQQRAAVEQVKLKLMLERLAEKNVASDSKKSDGLSQGRKQRGTSKHR